MSSDDCLSTNSSYPTRLNKQHPRTRHRRAAWTTQLWIGISGALDEGLFPRRRVRSRPTRLPTAFSVGLFSREQRVRKQQRRAFGGATRRRWTVSRGLGSSRARSARACSLRSNACARSSGARSGELRVGRGTVSRGLGGSRARSAWACSLMSSVCARSSGARSGEIRVGRGTVS